MSAPVFTPTTKGKTKPAGRWRMEVSSTWVPGSAVAYNSGDTWVPVFGVTNFSPGNVEYTSVPDTDYDSVDPTTGIVWDSSTKTGASWGLSGTVGDKGFGVGGNVRDPGQQLLIDRCDNNQQVAVRWFDRFGSDAYYGIADVKWMPQGGEATAASTANFELTGQGQRYKITSPVAAGTLPDAVSVAPTTGAAGTNVTITGTNLSAVTSVKFGGVESPMWKILSATSIRAEIPAGSAGSAVILVANPAGIDPATVAFART